MSLRDRPVWSSLCHAAPDLVEGNALAKRYKRDVNVFVEACDDSDAAIEAAYNLINVGETVFFVRKGAFRTSDKLTILKSDVCVQMVCRSNERLGEDLPSITKLIPEHGPEMKALAHLMEPGPFEDRTYRMGDFYGIRHEGRLVAMAGQRMRFPGYIELSGVCTAPEAQGRGYGRKLSAFVTRKIMESGETPFLHAWKANAKAIKLYEGLGYEIDNEVNVVVAKRESYKPLLQ